MPFVASGIVDQRADGPMPRAQIDEGAAQGRNIGQVRMYETHLRDSLNQFGLRGA